MPRLAIEFSSLEVALAARNTIEGVLYVNGIPFEVVTTRLRRRKGDSGGVGWILWIKLLTHHEKYV